LIREDVEEYSRRTTRSRALFRRAQKVLPSGSTRSPFFGTPYPFYAQRAEGCRVWDVDGNEYVDYVNNMGPLVLGHRHPAVERAVADQVASIWCGAPIEREIELAETILKAFPMGDRVLFTPSGTEALMKLARAARAASGKKKLAIDSGSFHGTSDSLSPGRGVPEELGALVLRYRYNDEASFRKVIAEHRDELAAVVIEAILGPAGGVPPTKSFLRMVREETERHGITLIFDEVVTGFRLARGGISELYSVRPDAVALGKIIGGGFPVGAFLGPRELMGEFSYSRAEFPMVGKARISHAGTFNAHPVTMAAGLATLGELTPERYQHLARLGSQVRRTLHELSDEERIPNSVTGIGSIFRLHVTPTEVTDAETANLSDEYAARLFDFFMLTSGVSLPRFHSAFCSTPMGKREMTQFKDAAAGALRKVKAARKVRGR
jgi:glutamate-1-semialdehyde 2,1-aminomutase